MASLSHTEQEAIGMTYREAVREFKREYIGLWINEVDYWTAQLAWSEYTDYLCKANIIKQWQWERWETPFPYGKRLRKPRIIVA